MHFYGRWTMDYGLFPYFRSIHHRINTLQFFRNIFEDEQNKKAFKKQLNNVLGFTPGDLTLYKTALSHRSVREGADENNERLEFLGDAVLSSLIAHHLFRKY